MSSRLMGSHHPVYCHHDASIGLPCLTSPEHHKLMRQWTPVEERWRAFRQGMQEAGLQQVISRGVPTLDVAIVGNHGLALSYSTDRLIDSTPATVLWRLQVILVKG